MLCVIWDRKGRYKLPKTGKCLNSCVCCNTRDVTAIAQLWAVLISSLFNNPVIAG